ncbi:purine nucleosidase/pyrimidine-specific ribonucleoside hydrolase [Rhizobiales bacterium GAS191]|nr:purine nucleosidase/pyrimidine-specific ribonucleoside hydrolase [Rhizobiales bacterium GAS191]
MPPIPVLIDTDPGLDDALALFLACASPELDIRGIVTVAGNIGLAGVTRNALNLLAHLGREEIPVIAGSARPVERARIEAADIHGEDGIGGVVLPPAQALALEEDATAWMARLLVAEPEFSLRILALGPLTNLAHLVLRHPDAARRLGGIIAMGGAVRERGNVTPFAEFNIAADPEAAAIVLRSGIPVTLVPLDVTRKVTADRQWSAYLAQSGGKIARTSAAMIEAYLEKLARRRQAAGGAAQALPATFPLHDPCVMLYAADPSLFEVERLPLRVVTDASERDGQTVIDPESGSAVDVLTQADTPRALALAFARLSGLG